MIAAILSTAFLVLACAVFFIQNRGINDGGVVIVFLLFAIYFEIKASK